MSVTEDHSANSNNVVQSYFCLSTKMQYHSNLNIPLPLFHCPMRAMAYPKSEEWGGIIFKHGEWGFVYLASSKCLRAIVRCFRFCGR